MPRNTIFDFGKSKATTISLGAASTWSSATSATIEDTTRVNPNNDSCIKMIAPAISQVSSILKTVALDLADIHTIDWWYYVEDYTKIVDLRIYFLTTSSTNSYSFVITTANNNIYNGWNHLRLRKSDFTRGGAGANYWDSGAVWTQLKLYINTTGIGQATSVTFSDLQINQTTKAKVIIDMADGRQSVYDNAYPIMAAKGYKGSFAIAGTLIPTNPGNGYCTKAQLQELYAAGWDMNNHTYDHVWMEDQTEAYKIDTITRGEHWLIGQGYTRNDCHKFLNTPGNGAWHTISESTKNVAKSLGIKAIIDGKSDASKMFEWMPVSDMHDLMVFNWDSNTTFSSMCINLDIALKTGATMIVPSHRVENSDPGGGAVYILTSMFQNLINAIYERDMDVVTWSEWYQWYNNARNLVSRV